MSDSWDSYPSDSNSGNFSPSSSSFQPLPDVGNIDVGTIAPIFGMNSGAVGGADYLDINIHGKSFSQNLTYNTGTSYLGGIIAGGVFGAFEGLRESPSHKFKIRLNSLLNACGKRGSRAGNAFGILAGMYTTVEHVGDNYLNLDEYIPNFDAIIPVASAAATGALYKSTAGPRQMALASVFGAGLMGIINTASNLLDN